MHFSTLALAAAFCDLSIAGYVLKDDYMTDFYGNFDFFTGSDPTHGFVKYVDEDTARQSNLISSNSTSAAQFGVDTQNITPNGRPSIRLESKKKYKEGLIVLDVEHMPFGCGTWPAFWMLGQNWPTGGEIDIIEGVNDYTDNAMTLHTGSGCAIGSDLAQFSGSVTTANCDVAAKDQSKNAGCSIKNPATKGYGAGLNQNGGGVYATQWDATAISVYFFPRGSIPADVLGESPDPSGWGKPAAKFAGACDIERMFSDQKIVINTAFCGDWAGTEEAWKSGSCIKKAATCKEYVRDNPKAFTDAYWSIKALKVYQDNGDSYPIPSAPSPNSTIKGIYSTAVPVSSLALSSALVPGVPSKPTIPFPSLRGPVPSNGVPIPGLPSPVPQGSLTVRPSRTSDSQIAIPTMEYEMKGWQWPAEGAGQSNGNPYSSAAPGPGTSAQVTPSSASSPTTAIVQPSQSSVVSQAQSLRPNAPEIIQTVYDTVYVTVSDDPVATPAPGVKARMARHARNHRRRRTQHHAQF